MMSSEQAKVFLQRMNTEPKLQQQIKQEYQLLLCDIARREGMAVSVEELQTELKEEKYRLNDEVLEKITGGISNASFDWFDKFGSGGGRTNTTGGGFNII